MGCCFFKSQSVMFQSMCPAPLSSRQKKKINKSEMKPEKPSVTFKEGKGGEHRMQRVLMQKAHPVQTHKIVLQLSIKQRGEIERALFFVSVTCYLIAETILNKNLPMCC
ncbi:rho-related GTP-binding protein RhoH [Platysternon megacephalum]|uniref:Rho-related GTP-binding protein RhoH n=1 Tax=Platysternon megacephalum TaxID=55544 RepID=A0A4D9EX01_9SAUR|nr:rho-related GTP-binding protein RhoH [Platysternon megacephalum]